MMRFDNFSFGSLRIDGATYEHDVVIDQGEVRKRKKKRSKKFRDDFGHTPLSIEEGIPWKCRRLVIGTGTYGRLPVMKEVKREAERRNVELLIFPTIEAIRLLEKDRIQRNLARGASTFTGSRASPKLIRRRHCAVGLPGREKSMRTPL